MIILRHKDPGILADQQQGHHQARVEPARHRLHKSSSQPTNRATTNPRHQTRLRSLPNGAFNESALHPVFPVRVFEQSGLCEEPTAKDS